jgi:hypothetical protein
MEWQAVVLAVQILLLATGWLLFQRARGELSVRAAETPILAEVRALQKSVKQLLAEIETTADHQSQRLESICSDASDILTEFEARVRAAETCLSKFTDSSKPTGNRSFQAVSRIEDRAVVLAADAALGTEARTAPLTSSNSQQGLESVATNSNQKPASMRDTAADHRDRVFFLADRGQSSAAIAQSTRLSEGEVETLLSLRGQRQ